MTPLGEKLRSLREERGLKLKDMAAALEVSPAYLSALEHGWRGTASAGLIHQICQYLGLIWDDADDLAALARQSRPRLKLNSAGLTSAQTALANRFARELRHLDAQTVTAIQALLDQARPVTPSERPRRAGRPAKREAAGPAQ
ncbi:helix-turn-helix domain-containing protein [Acidocella sp.]|jgi:transcriptional regulator with XRE-family HTH domain|uniref:helix-turn-helix domain-containing protein n=1 Tax=Acidocella sp. TaxID=50710 RepID=UPI002610FCC0|nr:helix-turn-helix transcriptional regulator [Acidocella sp.]